MKLITTSNLELKINWFNSLTWSDVHSRVDGEVQDKKMSTEN